MTIDATQFRAVLSRFATGVTIVTARDVQGRPHGMTVSAFASVSLEPPLILVSIGNDATIAPLLASVDHLAVNILAADQEALSRRFAGSHTDRFQDVAFVDGGNGCPLLDGALARLECRIVDRHDAGDHVIVIGHVETGTFGDGQPLLYFCGDYANLAR